MNAITKRIGICKAIIAIYEAQDLMKNDLISKDDKITTFLGPFFKLDDATTELIKLLAYENNLTIEES